MPDSAAWPGLDDCPAWPRYAPNNELAGVNAQLGFGIECQRDHCAGRISGRIKPYAHAVGAPAVGNRKVCRDQKRIAGRVGVDMQPLRDAEVQRDWLGLPAGTFTCSGNRYRTASVLVMDRSCASGEITCARLVRARDLLAQSQRKTASNSADPLTTTLKPGDHLADRRLLTTRFTPPAPS